MADFKVAIPFILSAEGGLSRNPNDNAHRFPAPWSYMGKTGWHTNRGITYRTFAALAPRLGYKNSPENFFMMPDPIWEAIYKYGYWDSMKGDQIDSPAVAVTLADYAFNFGSQGAFKRLRNWLNRSFKISIDSLSNTGEVIHEINKQTDKDEQVFFKRLITHRKAAYLQLNQPKNINGWLNRVANLENKGIALMKAHPIRTAAIIVGTVAILAATGLWIWYKKDKTLHDG